MPTEALALIAAKPGRLRDGLRAFLSATPHITAVEQVDDEQTAVQLMTDHQPALVLLDGGLPTREIQTMMRRLRNRPQQPRCIILVDNDRQGQLATAAGADAILVKGFSATHLFLTVEKLLTPSV